MAAPAPTTIAIRAPSKYASGAAAPFAAPPLEWLYRTWTVTHSTLAMWRTAQNVRITYAPLAARSGGAARIDDLVEYESNATAAKPGVKSVAGVDTAAAGASWDWRGKGLLFFVTSHWEVLGWGERPLAGGGVERWVVTWFAPTLFTKEGLDFYSDRREGLSRDTAAALRAALDIDDVPPPLAALVRADLQPVDIKLPWQER